MSLTETRIELTEPGPHGDTRCVGLPSTISQIVPFWAARQPDGVALVENAHAWTYGELDRAVRATAERLSREGIRPGDRAMLVCGNCCPAVVTYVALTQLAAWPVLVNSRLTESEVGQIYAHSGARRAIYACGGSRHAGVHPMSRDAITIESLALGEITLGSLNETAEVEPVEADLAARIAALIYTTGTTGQPKGVMLTHRNLLFAARASSQVRGITPADRLYCVLPISHILGLTSVLISGLLCGAQVHLSPRFDPAATIDAVKQDGITIIIGTPPMYALLAEYAAAKGLVPIAGPALRMIAAGGAPLDAASKAAIEKAFGLPLLNGYGTTETAPTLTLSRLDRPPTDCSVGQLIPGVEARLEGPDGGPVPAGQAGELFVRSPGVMKGYYKAPRDTAEVVDRDGWFRTGDLAIFDDDHVFIVGRSKDVIIRFGFKVYPSEVEAVLNAHPEVVRSAVAGRQATGGEEVLAFVQLKPGSAATPADLAEHAARELAPYKRPSKILVVASMPTSPTGKILKSALSAMA